MYIRFAKTILALFVISNLLNVCALELFAQNVQLGPIVGGVTENSARIYVRTNAPATVQVEASSSNFNSIDASAQAATNSNEENSVLLSLTGLMPDTRYQVRVKVNGNLAPKIAKFRSFPAVGALGNFSFLGGSCINELQDNDTLLFHQALLEDPYCFIYYGDWGYLDNTTDPYLPSATSYAASYANVTKGYQTRYGSTTTAPITQAMALDYIYDDHDYLNDNSGGNFAGTYNTNPFNGMPIGKPRSTTMPPQARQNVLRGYQNHFPAYPVPQDPEAGCYHSFRLGNAEIFVLDLRANRSPQNDAIVNQGSNWSLVEPQGHTLLGAAQKAWLFNGLQNSTADWKFIISSVTFNRSLNYVVDSCLKIGSGTLEIFGTDVQGLPIPATGYIAASRFVDRWAGYPTEQAALLALIQQQNIKNVFVISGDSHNAGIDDGLHSGVPELMSGNLRISNRKEAKAIQDFMGYSMWNIGGSGLCTNENYSTTFGKVEIFKRDSVRLSVVDAQGLTVAKETFVYNENSRYIAGYKGPYPPTAVADFAQTVRDSAVTISVLSNDHSTNGGTLFTALQTLPTNGTVSILPNGMLQYVPAPGFSGVDTFRYKACEAPAVCPTCAEALVTVNVQAGSNAVEGNKINKTKFIVYPNPVATLLQVQCEANSQSAFTIELFNCVGQTVQEKTFIQTTALDLSKIPGGYYFYNIRNNKGQFLQTGKINVLHH